MESHTHKIFVINIHSSPLPPNYLRRRGKFAGGAEVSSADLLASIGPLFHSGKQLAFCTQQRMSTVRVQNRKHCAEAESAEAPGIGHVYLRTRRLNATSRVPQS